MQYRHFGMTILVSITIILSASSISLADVFDIRVNDDETGTDQNDPRIAVDHSGDFVIVWTDKRFGNSDIFYQFFDSSGTSLGYNRLLNNDEGVSPQYHPAVAANNLDQFAAVWHDFRNGAYPFGADIFFAPIDTMVTPDNIELTALAPDSTREAADIAVLSDGSYVMVWSDFRNRRWDIYGQIVSPEGVMTESNFMISDNLPNAQQHAPRVAALVHGGFVVTWYDNRNGDDDIYAQRFDRNADPVGDNFWVNDDFTGKRQTFPAIAADINGRFFIAWTDWRNGIYPANPDIYVRRYNSDGTPVGPSESVVESDGGRPQRDCAICADAMGNICVAWADSSTNNWDVKARLIDHEGVMTPVTLILSGDVDDKQLQPDLAADGFKIFATWSDNRSGEFDIYASIVTYNEPALVPSVAEINFEMEFGKELPEPVKVNIINAGYGALDWSAVCDADWLTLTPYFGTTPDSFFVAVNDDSFANGDYYATIRLINLTHADSSVIIPVRLTVTSPIIDINPDTLYFEAHYSIGDPDNQKFEIANSGTGMFAWVANEESSWVEFIGSSAGVDGDSLTIAVSIAGLDVGHYIAPVEIVSLEAPNSPETCWVDLDIVGNLSYLAVVPDSLIFHAVVGESPVQQVTVKNFASGTLHWTADKSALWINLDKTSGTDDDVVSVGVNTNSMASGHYNTEILFTDMGSFNKTATVDVQLFVSSGDSVMFMNSNTRPGLIGVAPIFIDLEYSCKAAYIPFRCDSNVTRLDSMVFSPGIFPEYVDLYTGMQSAGNGEFGFRINPFDIGTESIEPGRYYLGNIFYTAMDTTAMSVIDTMYADSSGPYILNSFAMIGIPGIKAGSLFVGGTTGVDDDDIPITPNSIQLWQNYPNPFNSATRIEFALSRKTSVKIDIINSLGQTIRVFDLGETPSGVHEILWDGCLESAQDAPSGVYFFKLTAGEVSLTRKMVLLR